MSESGPSVFNPTGWKVEANFNGQRYNFAPGEDKQIWDVKVAAHLCSANSYKGLVHLTYNEKMQAKYPTYKEFYRAQVKNGIDSVLKHYRQAHMNEAQAKKECYSTKHGGSESDRTLMDPDRFEEKVKEIESWKSKYAKEWSKEDGSSDSNSKREAKVRRNDA